MININIVSEDIKDVILLKIARFKDRVVMLSTIFKLKFEKLSSRLCDCF